jgi:hypothetical protein
MSSNDQAHTLPTTAFPPLAKTKIGQSIALTVTLLLAISSLAQKKPSPNAQADSRGDSQSTESSAKPAGGSTTITVPAGTSIALVLTHPIQSRYIHRGDDIYAQVISAVTAGKQVVIPPGTLIQGKVDRLGRNGNRGELHLQSMSITYPDGYVATIAGPITLESDEGYALKDPGQGHMFGAVALPATGFGIGALIGHAVANPQPNTITSTLPPGCTGPPPGCLTSSVTGPGSPGKSTVIGAAVGGGIGIAAMFALLFHTHNFFLDVGAPIEMVLPRALTLEGDEVADASRAPEQHPAAEPAPGP